MFREVADAVRFADKQDPNLFRETRRVVVFVNGNKRAHATPGIWPYITQNNELIFLSTALLSERTSISTIAHELGHQLGLPDLYHSWVRMMEFPVYVSLNARTDLTLQVKKGDSDASAQGRLTR